MRLTHLAPSDPIGPSRLDMNTVARIEGVESFGELLSVLDELRAEHAPAPLLCTLDDLHQCTYTSAHAGLGDGLHFDEGEVDYDDPVAMRRVDDARVAHTAAALEDPGLRVEWDALPAARAGGEADVAALLAVNRDPDRVLDDVLFVQRVPVARDDLAIAGIPNGYFTDDWNTFENHAVVRRMAAHGYRHIGIGASLLGFDRETAPSADEARAVVADLVHLYGSPGSAAWTELTALLTERRPLIAGYTEDFAETLDR